MIATTNDRLIIGKNYTGDEGVISDANRKDHPGWFYVKREATIEEYIK